MRMLTVLFTAVLLTTACVSADVLVGQTAPSLELQNANDSTFTLASQRTQPLVLIFTTRDLGDFSLAWHDSIHTRMPDVQIQSVLDLSDVSGWLHGLAKVRIRAKGSKAIVDWDGEVSEQWRGEDRSQVVLFGLWTDNSVRFVVRGNADSERINDAVSALQNIETPPEQE